jgi:hypothetical protein
MRAKRFHEINGWVADRRCRRKEVWEIAVRSSTT